MSWDGYVQGLMQSNYLDGAAILGANGTVYAQSEGFDIGKHFVKLRNEDDDLIEVEVDEADVLISFFKNEGIVPAPPGIFLNGKRYHMLVFREDKNVGYLKCSGGGACVVKTNTLIIVGTWSTEYNIIGRCAGNCNQVIEEIADQFVKVNF